MAAETRRFWFKVAALAAPVLLPLAMPVAVLWRTGEFVTADQVADRILAGDSALRYSQGCTDQWRRFKLRIASSMSPNVLVLGGSSSLQLRGGYFEPPSYNAAATIGSVWHATEFLRRLGPAHRPKVVVLGLHPYEFLADWKPASRMFGGDFDTPTPTAASIIQSCAWQTASYVMNGRFTLGDVVHQSPRDVGMQVLIGAYFRRDGSYERGAIAPIPERFASQLADARTGANYLPFDTGIGATRLDDFKELLDYCRASGIHLVVYLPPMANPLREQLLAAGRFDYIFSVFSRLSPLAAPYGVTVFDATDLRTIGSSDAEMLDGTHPSETADLRLLLRLVELDSALGTYVDAARLRGLLAKASPLSVLGN